MNKIKSGSWLEMFDEVFYENPQTTINTLDKSDVYIKKLPRVDLTKHSIDRFSERCLDFWLKSDTNVGLMSFVTQKAREAYHRVLSSKVYGLTIMSCKVSYEGITYVFSNENGITTLVTVYQTRH